MHYCEYVHQKLFSEIKITQHFMRAETGGTASPSKSKASVKHLGLKRATRFMKCAALLCARVRNIISFAKHSSMSNL